MAAGEALLMPHGGFSRKSDKIDQMLTNNSTDRPAVNRTAINGLAKQDFGCSVPHCYNFMCKWPEWNLVDSCEAEIRDFD